MKLQLTQEDIDNSGPGSDFCPIACALKREYKSDYASVGTWRAFVRTTNGDHINFRLCESAKMIVRTFDHKGKKFLVPMEFELVEQANIYNASDY